ncbi:hypothetical protein [Arthrobacter sp. R-11]|uniref:hypothetical protein n=1 Tax=Arthrobacter sp. R-11 TaxID=3404053 RepID=UPI003CED11BB
MSRGHNKVFEAKQAGHWIEKGDRPHRVELWRWNDEPVSLASLVSGYDLEVAQFPVEDLDVMIGLLQQAKAALAGLTDSGAAAPSPAAVAPVTPQENEGPSAAATAEGR